MVCELMRSVRNIRYLLKPSSPPFSLSLLPLSLCPFISFPPSLSHTLSPCIAPVVCLEGLETLSFGYISVSAPLKGFQHPLQSSFSLLPEDTHTTRHTHTCCLFLSPLPTVKRSNTTETTLFVHGRVMQDEKASSEMSVSCRCPVNSVAGSHITGSGVT